MAKWGSKKAKASDQAREKELALRNAKAPKDITTSVKPEQGGLIHAQFHLEA